MQQMTLNRRSMLLGSLGIGLSHALTRVPGQAQATRKMVQTVMGPIEEKEHGVALPHEHILCDFIGAASTGPHRWNQEEVFQRMLPYLQELKKAGASTFYDCTPAYIGRDPVLLKRLSSITGLHVITNTGFYGGAMDKYVPDFAYKLNMNDMADLWIKEFEHGIGDTGIRPGFIKIGVDSIETESSPLSKIDSIIVQAAAQVSVKTNLSVTCHTGGDFAGLAALRLFMDHGGAASRFIVAHADSHGLPINRKVADLDGWVSYDAIGRRPLKQHLETVPQMLSHRADRLLLSQDNGWYSAGEDQGGDVRGYIDLLKTFLPALEKSGVPSEQIQQLIRHNTWNAFAS
jgi:phosphotriesterase-related protein